MAEAFNWFRQLDVWVQVIAWVGAIGTGVAIVALLKNHDGGERK